MAILNHDILREILIESANGSSNHAVTNFMLAGKETFKIALNYFSQVFAAEISETSSKISVRDANIIRFHDFPHDFPLHRFLTKNISEIWILKSPGRNILQRYIKEGLRKVIFVYDHNNIIHHELVKSCTTIESVRIQQMWSNIDLSMVPASCRHLKITNVPLLYKDFPKKLSFPSVETLEISGRFTKFFSENINGMMSFISASFPNLKCLNILFHASAMEDDLIFAFAKKLNTFRLKVPKKLCKKNIQGKIKFVGSHDSMDFEAVANEFIPKPDLVIDPETRIITKRIDISDNLSFFGIIDLSPVQSNQGEREFNYCTIISSDDLVPDFLVDGEADDDAVVF